MKPNNQVPAEKPYLATPNTFSFQRNRLLSFNTPKLSPLRMIQSPFMNLGENNLFENQLNLGNDFVLEEGSLLEENPEQVEESSDQSISEMEFPIFPPDAKITKENMIDFLVDSININEEKVQKVKQSIQQSGQVFLSEIFQYLYKRFKKTKKTKEEMIKYTMRKSFKFITDQMKRQDPSLIPLLSTDGLEGMSIYFTKHSEDQDISIPFKKNSLEKTMNTAFLKKVFSVERFYKDYKRFLKTFQTQFIKDNKKKISSMTESVKSCLNSKNYKALENYKRLPWTKDILLKLKEFAVDLLEHSPFTKNPQNRLNSQNEEDGPAKEQIEGESEHEGEVVIKNKIDLFTEEMKNPHKRSIDLRYDENFLNDYQDEDELDYMYGNKSEKRLKKKSVIILTPPILPMTSPKIPDMSLD